MAKPGEIGIVEKKPKKWIVALLLSIFLGSLGVDRFYMGYIGTGIAKLAITLVTVGMAGWVWWMIDIVLIAIKHDFAKVEWI
jgi:TM2 domain-containing membrane protein YozV